MKALEILYKLDTEYKYAQLNSDSCVRSQFINEAIKELEDLQKENEKLLKAKKYERLKLYKSIVELQIRLDIKKHLNRIYLGRNKGFMYFLLNKHKKIKD